MLAPISANISPGDCEMYDPPHDVSVIIKSCEVIDAGGDWEVLIKYERYHDVVGEVQCNIWRKASEFSDILLQTGEVWRGTHVAYLSHAVRVASETHL